jgi:hypothetical protein
VRADSRLIGKTTNDIDLSADPGLSILGLVDNQGEELGGQAIAEGHCLLIRGDARDTRSFINNVEVPPQRLNDFQG